MRVDPTYITNPGGFAGSDAGERTAIELGTLERREHHIAQPESGGRGRKCAAAEPDSAGRLVHASSSMVTGQLQVADSALGSVVTQLTQAISLATSANNGTMNASDVKSVGNQISGILDEVQSLANTSYQGQYIFAGGRQARRRFRRRRRRPRA
jgi:flagellar hook-associated protein 3 FlgL